MKVKGLVDEDLLQYKKPCMFIIFPYCSFKCDKEYGKPICQNSSLAQAKCIDIDIAEIIERYMNNPISKALCCGGLEPMDSYDDLYNLIENFRAFTDDDIVIYTGFNKSEIEDKIKELIPFGNIIIKYGRFTPNQKSHYDKVLGINLASDNQYAERI